MNWTNLTLAQKIALTIGSAISITLLYGIYKLTEKPKQTPVKPKPRKENFLSLIAITQDIKAKKPVFIQSGDEPCHWEDDAQQFLLN